MAHILGPLDKTKLKWWKINKVTSLKKAMPLSQLYIELGGCYRRFKGIPSEMCHTLWAESTQYMDTVCKPDYIKECEGTVQCHYDNHEDGPDRVVFDHEVKYKFGIKKTRVSRKSRPLHNIQGVMFYTKEMKEGIKCIRNFDIIFTTKKANFDMDKLMFMEIPRDIEDASSII